MRLWTIGYERLTPDALATELKDAGVRRLIDVRFRPQSRKAGLSKTALTNRLAQDGIAYEHRRALGTPPDIRVHYKQRDPSGGAQLFREHLHEPEQRQALDELAEELTRPTTPTTALLCLEEDPAVCHRREVANALQARLPGLQVIDL